MQEDRQSLLSDNATYRKIMWRIMPLLIFIYVLAFVDRTNIAFAKLQFLKQLNFSEAVFGFGGGLFYLGYIVFEVPSNLLLQKVGARITLLRIMLLWGFCCVTMAFIKSERSFYIVRFLLGAAEAGLFPGLLYYITRWVPSWRRARFIALLMASIPLAGLLGGPLAGVVMKDLQHHYPFETWQWLFIIEGVPAILIGVFTYIYLDDSPGKSQWLTVPQKATIERDLREDLEVSRLQRSMPISLVEMLCSPPIYFLSIMAFALLTSTSGIFFWLPTTIRSAGVMNVYDIGLLSAIPFGIGILIQYLNAWHSDKKREKKVHTVIPACISALGWLCMPFVSHDVLWSLVAITVATSGTLAAQGPFWAMCSIQLGPSAAASGLALISTLAGLGGFVSPSFMGWLTTRTGSLAASQYYVVGLLIIGALTVLLIDNGRSQFVGEDAAVYRGKASPLRT